MNTILSKEFVADIERIIGPIFFRFINYWYTGEISTQILFILFTIYRIVKNTIYIIKHFNWRGLFRYVSGQLIIGFFIYIRTPTITVYRRICMQIKRRNITEPELEIIQ